MATMKRKGFGQVEPNHISGNIDGSIYAQRPVDTGVMGKIIENGRFAKYAVVKRGDGVKEVVTTNKDTDENAKNYPWLMIYNEVKLYDEREKGLKDYAMKAVDFIDGELTPRLIEINVGDIFTTNTLVKCNTSATEEIDLGISPVAGTTTFKIGDDGYLVEGTAEAGQPEFVVIKVYTMPDMQDAVKLQRIK